MVSAHNVTYTTHYIKINQLKE